MKKIIACIVALMVCATMVIPAFAAEDTFTPSVTNKPAPEIVPVMDPEGNPALGEILQNGEVVGYVYGDCLVITSVAEALTSTTIPTAARDMLLDVYNKLIRDEMKIPYDIFGSGLDGANMVIRDLFDISFLCGGSETMIDHPEMLEDAGVVLRLTFNLGVGANDKVYTSTYKNDAWNAIISTVNNGDGTVTCTFDHLCPVAFSVETGEPETPPTETGDPEGEKLGLWITVAAVSLVAVVTLVTVYVVKSKKQ